MKKTITLLVLTVFCALSVHAADVKIGYVDLQKALNNCAAGIAAMDKVSVKVKEFEKQVEQKQKEIKGLQEALVKQGLVLSEEKRADKKLEIEQKETELDRFAKDMEKDFKRQDSEFTRLIITDIVKIVNDLGVKEGYTAIFEKSQSAILYGDQTIDLTDKAIKIYDAAQKK